MKFRTVFATAAGGPGDEAGVKTGDQILEVDGRPAVSFTLESLRKFLRENRDAIVLTVSREGEELKVTVKPREIVTFTQNS